MDSETLRLECLKIAAEEVKTDRLAPQKLIERAGEFVQFVFKIGPPEGQGAAAAARWK